MKAVALGLPEARSRRAFTLRAAIRWPTSGWRRAVVPLVLLGLWEVGGRAGLVSPAVLPPPSTIARAAVRLALDGTLVPAVAISLARLLLGFALGAMAGLGLGVAVGLSARGEQLFDGTMQALRAIPFLALAPMFSLWFGADEAAKIALVAFGAMFPLYLNTAAGIRGVDARLAEAARTCGVGRVGIVRDVVLPGATPAIMVGARLSFSWALAALVSSEIAGAATGIGALIAQSREFAQTDVVILCVLIYALLGLAADGLVRFAEWRLLTWRRSFAGN